MFGFALGRGQVIAAIEAALESAQAGTAAVLVVGDPQLARALSRTGRAVATVVTGRAARKAPGPIDDLPAPRSQAALVGVGAGVGIGIVAPSAASSRIAAWAGVVRDGGVVILIDRDAAEDATRLALCGGLSELEQRAVGRTLITSGLVTAW